MVGHVLVFGTGRVDAVQEIIGFPLQLAEVPDAKARRALRLVLGVPSLHHILNGRQDVCVEVVVGNVVRARKDGRGDAHIDSGPRP